MWSLRSSEQQKQKEKQKEKQKQKEKEKGGLSALLPSACQTCGRTPASILSVRPARSSVGRAGLPSFSSVTHSFFHSLIHSFIHSFIHFFILLGMFLKKLVFLIGYSVHLYETMFSLVFTVKIESLNEEDRNCKVFFFLSFFFVNFLWHSLFSLLLICNPKHIGHLWRSSQGGFSITFMTCFGDCPELKQNKV